MIRRGNGRSAKATIRNASCGRNTFPPTRVLWSRPAPSTRPGSSFPPTTNGFAISPSPRSSPIRWTRWASNYHRPTSASPTFAANIMPPRAPRRRRSAARPAVSMANTPGRAGWLFPSLHGYSLSQLPRDAIAALILTAIAVPGQLATARLMGLPPMVGLFAFAAGSLAFAALGANRFASVAADSTIAPIMAGALVLAVEPGTPHYAALAAVLALLVGVILLVAGVFRAGWIADLLSVPVTV